MNIVGTKIWPIRHLGCSLQQRWYVMEVQGVRLVLLFRYEF